ncbi:hypothetical protein M1O51_02650 [Dehalococcoidia bacterium]|nr:hypothetical protein [Dehalococcoidia bacterium]
MIPKNIKLEHILKAIEEIKRNGIPKGRNSRKFFLELNGDYYPPKYVISLANKYVNGKELDPEEFSGGEETNTFLRKLGFNIVEISILRSIKRTQYPKIKKEKFSDIHHNERCPKCKETIRKLLHKIYGEVKVNYNFNVGTSPEDFKHSSYYHKLKEIYETLQNHRGFKEFVKAKTLPNCDFFISNPGFIVEFDESQHFTLPRKITLEKYPHDLKLGFNREKWIRLCEEINARDNDPPYRDEQRAWYDTLRDFLPVILGLKPTVRLFARDFVWCGLNPEDPRDVEKFMKIIKKRNERWEIKVREDSEPFLARIIIANEWEGKPEDAKILLEKIHEKWPKGKKVKFLITCGGFIQFDWPKYISKRDIRDKYPNPEVINILVEEAKKCVEVVLSKNLCDKLKTKTDYITLGVDSYKEKISTTQNYINQLHIELVFLVDLRNDKFYWTGKSYPTPNQQNGLVRIADLKSHFFDLDVGKVMILGCHDLTIFNPRSKNAKGWRKRVNEEFKKLAQKMMPEIVLQHPHTTVKIRTWLNAWRNLSKLLPSVKIYASAGRYHEPDRDLSKYDRLEDVLKSTRCGGTIDFIINNLGGY